MSVAPSLFLCSQLTPMCHVLQRLAPKGPPLAHVRLGSHPDALSTGYHSSLTGRTFLSLMDTGFTIVAIKMFSYGQC